MCSYITRTSQDYILLLNETGNSAMGISQLQIINSSPQNGKAKQVVVKIKPAVFLLGPTFIFENQRLFAKLRAGRRRKPN